MTTSKPAPSAESWIASTERTSQTDDQRIKDVMPLPPPEHLIRFFPIAGTPVETLVGHTRAAISWTCAGWRDARWRQEGSRSRAVFAVVSTSGEGW